MSYDQSITSWYTTAAVEDTLTKDNTTTKKQNRYQKLTDMYISTMKSNANNTTTKNNTTNKESRYQNLVAAWMDPHSITVNTSLHDLISGSRDPRLQHNNIDERLAALTEESRKAGEEYAALKTGIEQGMKRLETLKALGKIGK